MNALILKLNNSVKFIVCLAIFAFIFVISSNKVNADVYYPNYLRGFSDGFNSGTYYNFSPFSSTNDYLSYSFLSSYPYLRFSYNCDADSQLNMLINFNSVSNLSTFTFGYHTSSSSVVTSQLTKGLFYSYTDYLGNVFNVCCIGETITLNIYVSSSSNFSFYIYGSDLNSGTLTVYNSYYILGDSSGGTSIDYTSVLSSIYNQLVSLNADTDTMLTYLNTIINNLVSLNADTNTIISELQTINSLIGSSSSADTVLYYLYRISTYTSYTPNIYNLLYSWYQTIVIESEDTSIDSEIESDLAVVESQVADSVGNAISSQTDMISADSSVDDSIQSGFDSFDDSLSDITDSISLTEGTGLYSAFGIFSLLFADVFSVSEFNTYLYILLFIGLIGTVLGVAVKLFGGGKNVS